MRDIDNYKDGLKKEESETPAPTLFSLEDLYWGQPLVLNEEAFEKIDAEISDYNPVTVATYMAWFRRMGFVQPPHPINASDEAIELAEHLEGESNTQLSERLHEYRLAKTKLRVAREVLLLTMFWQEHNEDAARGSWTGFPTPE
ncbi:hypothetical protein [Subtercola sp. RTI3]|uniref:hypothetical protein n=1 Tax=Subtercola sp. RTI3 TaxID=3048639 RepID=UPI002B2271E6|nr:hypothetical protein [Subtercola sp. RTI3]MEA9985675.1 hypothetical protein [Subtercola sp. RTI3]